MPTAPVSSQSPAGALLGFRESWDLGAEVGREGERVRGASVGGRGGVSAHAQPEPSQQPPAQDGGAWLSVVSCVREHEGLCAAVFQFRVESARRQKPSPGGCDGRGGGQTGRAAVHQRGSRARQRRGPRLLPDLSVSAVGGHSRHPRPHRPLRLHLLPARVRPALSAPDSQSGKAVEQVF